ncbi:tetratricopeptide repeat protein [Paenarthrobacter sp. JL.01a]|uniref:tetratricopeptide repeat protein n=1 Tax=Paenarthrobacter sp. JL.01a TaxID=2979324 RepID=UPI0021C88EC6|nr:tetratricopeptide repeat protein [Paenarthrobacter sp. JL.01a]UXM92234.1 tetratricopeptide repeat protein [Paenarthrobacter sp. JL.01a]
MEATASAPDNADLHGQLSRVFASAKDWKAALESAQRALDLEPEEPWWWLRLSGALVGNGDLQNAEAAIRWGLNIAGGEWIPGLYMLGCILYDQAGPEQLAEAEQLFVKVVELSPENADYRYMLANALIAREKGLAAEQQIEAGLEIDPFHTNLLLMRATNPSRPADGRVESLLGVLQLNPNEARARASLESEYFRIRVRRHTAWWLLAVADAALLLWVPQVFYVLLVPFLWVSLFFVALVNSDARKALPKGYARRMDRKYAAATWTGRLSIAAALCVPIVVLALYGEHGSVAANIVVSILLVASAVVYSVYRWLVIRARHTSLSPEREPTELRNLLAAADGTNGAWYVLFIAFALTRLGFHGPQPAATGVLLLTAGLGSAWWWIAWNMVLPPHKLARDTNGGTRRAWQLALMTLLVLGMIVAGVVIVASHDFVVIPNYSRP